MNQSITHSIRHLIEYVDVLFLRWVFRLLPFGMSMRFACHASPILSSIFPIRRKIILENLRTAFPEADEKTLSSLVKDTYRNFFLLIVEFIKFEQRDLNDLMTQITVIEGEKYFNEVGAGKKPFLALTAHIGNWELMGAYFAARHISLSVLAKPIHNNYIDRLVNRMRKKKGLDVISTQDSPIRDVLEALKGGQCVAFLADQDARRAGIFTDFFGKPASTFTGPALFSFKTGLPLLPVFDVRTGISTHKVIFFPPIYPSQSEPEREEAIRDIIEKYTRILEDVIRKYPGQYFWFHRRWKTQPREPRNTASSPA